MGGCATSTRADTARRKHLAAGRPEQIERRYGEHDARLLDLEDRSRAGAQTRLVVYAPTNGAPHGCRLDRCPGSVVEAVVQTGADESHQNPFWATPSPS